MPRRKNDDGLSRNEAWQRLSASLPAALQTAALRAADDIVTWAEQAFSVLEPLGPIRLAPHQKSLLRLLERRRPDGRHAFTTVVYSAPKKSGKTTVAALVARYRAETGLRQEIVCAANDLEQAQGRVFQAIRTSIELNEHWERHWETTHRVLRHRASGSVIRAVPSDFKGEAGGNHSMAVFTELWGYETEAARRLYEELTPVPTRDSTRLVETYAGFEGEADLLWDLYEQGVLSGRQHTGGELDALTGCGLGVFAEAESADAPVPVWVDEPAGLLVYWDSGEIARRMPWQQGERGVTYYAEQAATLRPAQFDRLHNNRWVTPEEAFVPLEWWDACADAPGPPLLPGLRDGMVLAADASVTGDTTALVGVTRHPDHRRHPDELVVRFARCWQPSRERPMNYAETLLPAIREACEHWNVTKVCYDAYQLHQPMTDLKRELMVWVSDFKQQSDRERADKQRYDLIRERRIHHFGEQQPALRAHVLQANAKLSGPDERRMRIVKRSSGQPIDLVVALSMAAYEARRLNI